MLQSLNACHCSSFLRKLAATVLKKNTKGTLGRATSLGNMALHRLSGVYKCATKYPYSCLCSPRTAYLASFICLAAINCLPLNPRGAASANWEWPPESRGTCRPDGLLERPLGLVVLDLRLKICERDCFLLVASLASLLFNCSLQHFGVPVHTFHKGLHRGQLMVMKHSVRLANLLAWMSGVIVWPTRSTFAIKLLQVLGFVAGHFDDPLKDGWRVIIDFLLRSTWACLIDALRWVWFAGARAIEGNSLLCHG